MNPKKQTILNKAYSNSDLDDISRESQMSKEFYDILISFIIEHPEFKYVCGLNAFDNVPGTYVIALNSINKFKVGYTSDLYSEILEESQKIPTKDIFSYGKVFINPNIDSLKDIESLFPAEMIADDFGGVKMNSIEMRDKLRTLDKTHVAIATGGILAVVGAVALIKYLVTRHD